MAGPVARMERTRNSYTILAGKSLGKVSTWKVWRQRCEDNIKMNFRDKFCEDWRYMGLN
jgi:hypothetical protein